MKNPGSIWTRTITVIVLRHETIQSLESLDMAQNIEILTKTSQTTSSTGDACQLAKKLRKYFKLRPHEVDSSEINTLTTELSVEMSYFIRIHIICQSRPSYHLKYNELQKNGN